MAFYEFEGRRPVVEEGAFVHPKAVLIGAVRIGTGCYIGAGAVLRGDIGTITVGPGSNVQENGVLHTFPGKSIILHKDTHIGHACILHGCEICSNVLVGMGSTIADGVKVNSDCLIGAGSLILFGVEIPAGSVVAGSPARVIKPVSEEQLRQISSGRAVYQDLARRYLKAFKKIPAGECVEGSGASLSDM